MMLDFVHFLLVTGQLMRYSAREAASLMNSMRLCGGGYLLRLSGNRGWM